MEMAKDVSVMEGVMRDPVVYEVMEKTLEVTVSRLAETLGQYLYGYSLMNSGVAKIWDQKGITERHVSAFVSRMLELRIYQVAEPRLTSRLKQTQYPKCLYPILESLGRFQDAESGIQITLDKPKGDPTFGNTDEELAIVSAMRMAGIPIGEGFPIVTTVENDMFYRLAVDENGVIRAASLGGQPDPYTLLARVFFQFLALSDVYGAYRYSMGDVRSFSTAIDRLSMLGVNLRY